jgi:hypothetical protein
MPSCFAPTMVTLIPQDSLGLVFSRQTRMVVGQARSGSPIHGSRIENGCYGSVTSKSRQYQRKGISKAIIAHCPSRFQRDSDVVPMAFASILMSCDPVLLALTLISRRIATALTLVCIACCLLACFLMVLKPAAIDTGVTIYQNSSK